MNRWQCDDDEAGPASCTRYLEEVQAGRLLPEAASSGGGGGKYDVSRQIALTAEEVFTTEGTESTEGMRLLDAA